MGAAPQLTGDRASTSIGLGVGSDGLTWSNSGPTKPGKRLARVHAAAGPHPAARVGHDHREVAGDRADVGLADQGTLRVRVRRSRPVPGHQRVVLAVERIFLRDLVVHLDPVRAERRRLEPDLAEDRVGAEKGHVHALIAGPRHGGPHGRRPVLVVPLADHGPGARQDVWVQVEVDAGDVGQRQPESFGEGDQRELQLEVGPGPVVIGEGPVKGDLAAAVGEAAAGAAVQAVLAPAVVGLVGRHRRDQHDPARRRGRADHHRHVALHPRRGIQPEQIRTGRPAGRRHGQARRPGRHRHRSRLDDLRPRLEAAWRRRRGPHQAGQVAAVPAHPERADPEAARRGRHEQPERGAGRHVGPVGETLELVEVTGMRDPPARVTGQRVLGRGYSRPRPGSAVARCSPGRSRACGVAGWGRGGAGHHGQRAGRQHACHQRGPGSSGAGRARYGMLTMRTGPRPVTLMAGNPRVPHRPEAIGENPAVVPALLDGKAVPRLRVTVRIGNGPRASRRFRGDGADS